MTSEIRVNKINNRAGLGTVEYTPTGIIVSGIVTAYEFDGNFDTTPGIVITGIGTAQSLDVDDFVDVGSNIKLGNAGVVTATTFSTANVDVTTDKIVVGTGVTIEANQVATGQATFTGIVTASSFKLSDGSTVGFSPDAQNNLFAGTDAGASLNSSSSNNVLFGQDAGDSITEGEYNVCIGLRAGQALTDVDKNVCIGNDAGRNFNAGDSVFIGWYAGAGAGSNGNVCIGHMAGSEANGNETAYGYSSGPTASYSGNTNVCMGFASGNGLRSSASRNTILGPGAGRNDSLGQVNINGSDNIILGSYSSVSSVSASNECVIGAVYGSSKAINHFRIPGIGCSISEGGAVITGIVTATSFSGDGSNLSNLPASAPVGGASTNAVFFENDVAVAVNYQITSNKNAMSAGPIAINAGIAVTVPSGSSWTIV